MGNLSLAEKADSKSEQMFKCRLQSWHRTPIIISLSVFHLNREGNGTENISPEEHFKTLETKRASYLLYFWNCLFFAQIFEFYLVIQSL